MMLTVRLKPEEWRRLQAACRRMGKTQSEAVRYAIARLFDREEPGRTAAQRWDRWIGCWDSGGKNLSRQTGRKARAAIKRKHEQGRLG